MGWRLIQRLTATYPITRLRAAVQRFASDRRGVVAVTLAASAAMLMVAVGSGLDLERVYNARQQLSAVATLTCQYSNRPIVVSLAYGSGGSAAYASNVNNFYALALAAQNAAWTQTTSTPFTYTSGGAGNIALAAVIRSTIMQLIAITTIPVSVSMQCFSAIATLPQPVADASATMIVNDGGENSAYPSSIADYLPTGHFEPYGSTTYSMPVTNTAPTTVGYVGTNGAEWIIMGYCLEVDPVGKTQSTVPQGTHSVELDCDNGSHSAGNSSMSTKVYMQTGSYELRWDYAARIPDPYYGSSYICGSTAADTYWANDTAYTGGFGARTNQVNVYFDKNTTGSPPTHTTIDGTQTLGGSNLIDECVYSSEWIERSIPIAVTTAGYYWLSFAADGASDSYGGDIDNIRLCVTSCPGTPADPFPTTWLAANNGYNNVVLFEDTFENPSYANGTPYYNLNGNVGVSIGSSSVWNETGKGWGIAPVNQLPYWLYGCPQGNQCIEIGWHDNANYDIGIAKPFLLDPGYYQISYYYVSENTFTGLSGVYCGSTPTAARVSTLTGGSGTGMDRVIPSTNHGTIKWSSGLVGLFMVSAQLASEPDPSSAFQSTTTYTSKTGAGESYPSVPANSISLTNYDPTQSNPLLDICGYAATAQLRTATIQIQKPALYWLVFSILGVYTAFGAQIDDVKITALGSPSMSIPPPGATTIMIPVPGPQPGATLGFTGFSTTETQY